MQRSMNELKTMDKLNSSSEYRMSDGHWHREQIQSYV